MKGYKVFDPNWTCRGLQYQVGESYEMDVEPIICDRGFHFCKELENCFKHYAFNPQNKVAEVEAYGDVISECGKSCTNKIKIVREIPWDEVLRITTQDITTQDITTRVITTQDITTQEIATQDITTQGIATQEIATQEITTQDITTQDITTQEIATQDITTRGFTTQEIATQEIATRVTITQVTIIAFRVRRGASTPLKKKSSCSIKPAIGL